MPMRLLPIRGYSRACQRGLLHLHHRPRGCLLRPQQRRIHRHGQEAYGILDQNLTIPPEWLNETARLSGYLKTENADGGGGGLDIIQAVSGSSSILRWDHMDASRLKGNQPWQRRTVEIKVPFWRLFSAHWCHARRRRDVVG